ncbi:MAG: hypothetical protein LW823_08965 [Rickettsiales bacterium]|jgi:hypothetical protein|nr:hypothetical protein [Rickettsiales bacterium]
MATDRRKAGGWARKTKVTHRKEPDLGDPITNIGQRLDEILSQNSNAAKQLIYDLDPIVNYSKEVNPAAQIARYEISGRLFYTIDGESVAPDDEFINELINNVIKVRQDPDKNPETYLTVDPDSLRQSIREEIAKYLASQISAKKPDEGRMP